MSSLGQSTWVPSHPTSCDEEWRTKHSRKKVVVVSVKQTEAGLILSVNVQRGVAEVSRGLRMHRKRVTEQVDKHLQERPLLEHAPVRSVVILAT